MRITKKMKGQAIEMGCKMCLQRIARYFIQCTANSVCCIKDESRPFGQYKAPPPTLCEKNHSTTNYAAKLEGKRFIYSFNVSVVSVLLAAPASKQHYCSGKTVNNKRAARIDIAMQLHVFI